METRKEKIKREIDNFVKVLEERSDKDAAEFFNIPARILCIQAEKPLCFFLSASDRYIDRLDVAIESGADPNFQDLCGRSALHLLASRGKKSQIELLFNKTRELGFNLDVNLLDNQRNTPLDHAVSGLNSSIITLLQSKGAKASVDLDYHASRNLGVEMQETRTEEIKKLLQKAVEQNHEKAIGFLTMLQCHPVKDAWPLHICSEKEEDEVINLKKWMIKNGASVNPKNGDGRTPLHVAAGYNLASTVELLCENGASVNVVDGLKNTPLYYAVVPKKNDDSESYRAKIRIMKTLISYGADPKIAGMDGRTPMDFLTPKIKAEIEEYITKIASEKISSTDMDISALNIPLSELRDSSSLTEQKNESKDSDKVTFIMVTKKEKIEQEIDSFVMALEKMGDSNAARFFTQIAKPKCIAENKPLCYYLATTPYYLDRLNIAIESGADPNFPNVIGDTALHALAFSGKKDQIEFLLNIKGVDVNIRNLAGSTPLDFANARSQSETIALLKTKGAIEGNGDKDLSLDLSSENQTRLAEYDTLLQKAIEENKRETIAFLKTFKSFPVKVWPLHAFFLFPQNIEIAEWMLDNGANFNARDGEGRTPLHMAAFFCKEQMVKKLCQKTIDVNVTDNNGSTPLHYAILQKKEIPGKIKIIIQDEVKLQIIKTLIDCGADPKISNCRGKTPIDLLDPKLKTEIEEYIAKIASEKVHSVDVSSLGGPSGMKDYTLGHQDESQDSDMKILKDALEETFRDLQGEGI
ncbi:hypothetical protein phytr_4400 [Candidatus Phycorickettsia trachydisci]|uniref:Uncharacterized protein n=1 Tax=Candidatus Phycorickettsia trachydisci TaxID=2115978 RepID=A0A2P1P7Z3_9RICK|nr:ankyrin repeat domain-containing protein [Candidatus Phycorickettsia trachydisci]AVP87390.1 hypothetical protein phytr_4400 [Candidatus Phycorickettsia trachydisci]